MLPCSLRETNLYPSLVLALHVHEEEVLRGRHPDHVAAAPPTAPSG
jgi:hypothetical protein